MARGHRKKEKWKNREQLYSTEAVTTEHLKGKNGFEIAKGESVIVTPVPNQIYYPDMFWVCIPKSNDREFQFVMAHRSTFKLTEPFRAKEFMQQFKTG